MINWLIKQLFLIFHCIYIVTIEKHFHYIVFLIIMQQIFGLFY